MIGKILKATLGLVAFGIGAAAASAVVLGNKRVDAWETLTPDDADEGDFVTLSDGARMHYVARGDRGDPVVLIHGLIGSTHEWSENIEALAHTRRVWAIDLIGFGFSSRVTEPTYSLKYYSRSIREFLDAQGIARASLVGHSLGGAVTLQFAHDYPERVDQLILIAPAAYMLNLPSAVNMAARVPFVPRALMGFATTNTRARLAAWRIALGDPKRFDPAEMALRLRTMRVKGTTDALVSMLASPRASDLPRGLKTIQARTLLIWGDQDLAVPVAHGERLSRDLPNAELVILEGAGHVPHAEFPAVVNPLLLDFLTRDERNLAKVEDPAWFAG
ncbi:MAG: alpha/beta fold hydrolase [Chloroflexota bacterium]|nr:alpha/beta fold hydrolase [Chloroflexota bacterium]